MAPTSDDSWDYHLGEVFDVDGAGPDDDWDWSAEEVLDEVLAADPWLAVNQRRLVDRLVDAADEREERRRQEREEEEERVRDLLIAMYEDRQKALRAEGLDLDVEDARRLDQLYEGF